MLAFCPRAQLLYYFSSPISTQILLCLQEYIQESIFSGNYINCPPLFSTTRVLLPDQEGRNFVVETLKEEESGEKEEDEYSEGNQLNSNNNIVKTKKGKERKYNKAGKKRKTRRTNQSKLT